MVPVRMLSAGKAFRSGAREDHVLRRDAHTDHRPGAWGNARQPHPATGAIERAQPVRVMRDDTDGEDRRSAARTHRGNIAQNLLRRSRGRNLAVTQGDDGGGKPGPPPPREWLT